MIRGLVGCVGVAVAMTGTTGCYVNTSHRTIGAPHTSIAPAIPVASAAVNIDGRPRELRGHVACTRDAGDFSIAVGEWSTGVEVTMTPDRSSVTAVQLGEVNGVLMGYRAGAHGGNAAANRKGPTYTITGTATGVRAANPAEPLTTDFDIVVTCP